MKEIAAAATEPMPDVATARVADAGARAVDLDLIAARMLRSVREFLAASDDSDAIGNRVGALTTAMQAADLVAASATTLAADPATSRQAEKESLGLEGLLDLKVRRTTGDLKTMLAAGSALADMPHTRAAFRQGRLSWGEVRAITAGFRRLRSDQRALADRAIAQDTDHLGRLHADDVLSSVDSIGAELNPEADRRKRRRQFNNRYLNLQPGFDGSLAFNGETDATTGPAILAALDHATRIPTDDDPAADPDPAINRQRANIDGLEQICAAYLSGADRKRARPLLTAIVDADTIVNHPDHPAVGWILAAARGHKWRLNPDTADLLACDARIRPILTKDGRIVGIGTPSDQVPAWQRQALAARDGGCRWPGCDMPATWTDAHHILPASRGGPTHPDNLILLCRRHHTTVHRGRWHLKLAPDATLTIRRGPINATSLPLHKRRLTTRPPPAD